MSFVFLAALFVKGNLHDRLYRLWFYKKFEIVTSQWQLDEIKRVSCCPKVQKLVKPYEVGRLVNGLKFYTVMLEELPKVEAFVLRRRRQPAFGDGTSGESCLSCHP
jgi:uncharacterized protein